MDRQTGTRVAAMAAGLLAAGLGLAQTATPGMPNTQEKPSTETPQLSPADAYQQAVRPIELTHRSVANWSEIEQASLAVAIRQASADCGARSSAAYAGGDLADYARLCALGQAWPTVLETAGKYLSDKGNEARRAELYAEKIDAELHLKQEAAALVDANAMLADVPYSAAVGDALDEAISYMEVLYTPDAVSLAAAREKPVLEALGKALAKAPPVDADTPASGVPAPVPVTDLYRQALALPLLEQFNQSPEKANRDLAALDQAVGEGLTSGEQTAIAAMRRKYMQLGMPLGTIAMSMPLDVTGRLPQIPANRAVTVLLVFPDWCAQAVRLVRQMPESVFTVEGHEAYAYGLLVQTMPAKKAPAAERSADAFDPALAASYLRGTPTVVVDAQLLARFAAVDAPVLIATDSRGLVRYIGTADDNVFQPGQTADSLVSVIAKRWPYPVSGHSAAKAAPPGAGSNQR